MLVKQWLREYMVGEHISPKERCRVRYLRHQGLVQWRVFEIAAVLPLLLQFSLILFFVGLCDFARSLHPVVAWVVTTSIIVWLVVYAAGTIAPAFSDFCPYNTPSLRSSLKYIRSLLVRVGSHQSQAHIFDDGQQFVRTNPKLDMEVLVGADKAFMDADFLGIIRQCLADYGGHIVVPWIREMIERRTNSKVKSLARISSLWDLTITEQATTVHVLVDTIHRSLDRHYRYGELLEWGSWMGEALACVNAIANVEQLPSVEQVVSRLLAHGEEITKGTLECLSSTFYLPHRGRGLPHAFSPQCASSTPRQGTLTNLTLMFSNVKRDSWRSPTLGSRITQPPTPLRSRLRPRRTHASRRSRKMLPRIELPHAKICTRNQRSSNRR